MNPAADGALPAPDPAPLAGRGLVVIHAPADGPRLAPLIRIVRAAGPRLRVRAPTADEAGWLAGVAEPIDGAPVERVVLFWSAAAAALPRIERLRGETGSVTGDRLAIVPLDPTPMPAMLARCASPTLDRCLRALAEHPAVGSAPEAISLRLATLARVQRRGAALAAVCLLAVAAVLWLWRFPTPSADPTDRAVMRVVMLILIPCVAGLFAMIWARVDRRFLAHRAGSYLIDRALEERA